MKIKQDHYEYMREALRKRMSTITPHILRTYLQHLQDDPTCADPHKRIRFDLLWSSGISSWVCSTLYPYLNDDHIDTALRRAMQELTSHSFDN